MALIVALVEIEETIKVFEIDRYPLISIVLPMYNAEHYISDAIESIMNQSYSNWELIVIDDGSTDNSFNVVQTKYDDKYANIRLLHLSQNEGIVKALNQGIAACNPQSSFIARMDADDISNSNRMEKQIKFMIANPEIDVLGSGVSLFDDESGRILKTVTYQCLSTASIKWCSLFFCPLNHSTILFKAKCKIRYDEKYKHCEDYALWMDLLFDKKLKFAQLNESLLKLRKNQIRNKSVNVSKKYRNEQANASTQLVFEFVCQRLHFEGSIDVIECIQNPKKIKDTEMFQKCYLLLEKWENFVLNDADCTEEQALSVKNDCDERMAELISLWMHFDMIGAIKMIKIWKLRKPKKSLIERIL